MMDTNEDRLSMSGTSVSMSDMHSEQVLLPNIEHMMNMDDQFIQLFGNQPYMMTDGPQMSDTTRNVVNANVNTIQSSHLTDMNSHSIDTCNYVSNYAQHYHDTDAQQTYNVKYRGNSSLSSPNISTVSETVTHVSETDNSLQVQTNFVPVSSAVSVTPINVNDNFNMTSVNNWSHSGLSDHNHMRSVKDVSAINVAPKVMPQTCQLLRPRISNYMQNAPSMALSMAPSMTTSMTTSMAPTMVTTRAPSMAPATTSTPVSVSQTINLLAMNNHSKVHQQNHIKPDVQQSNVNNKLSDFTLVEKRTVITFRVVDQIIDLNGKIIKETIVKDEEIVKSLGKSQWNDSLTPSSTISSVSRFPSNTNSGDLGDISSSGKSTPSGLSQTNEQLLRVHSNNNELFNKIPTPVGKHTITKDTSDFNVKTTLVNIKKNNELNAMNTFVDKNLEEGISEIEEEERRETATALLSLQTQRSLNIDIGSSDQLYMSKSSLRQGSKIMGKWRDKNFYPAIISKYLPQNNKWMVTFEDKATRNLFENELIRIEFLIEGQDVMVAISEGFCVKGTIKRVISDNKDNVYEVEHIKEDKKVMKQYQLKDLFLNAEQGASLTLKSAKHSINGAVFADVDLDNIVCGKRARTTKQDNIINKNMATFKNGKRRPAESDVFDINDYNEEEEEIPFKAKKKAIYVRTTKKKTESLHTHFNSEHSLSISPRTTKASISMPPQELIKLLGPLPENLVMFEGVSFLLTCGDRGNKNDEKCSEESNAERSTPFDKFYLIKQIETGGGKVFESFDDAKNSENNCDIVLIADTYYRSIKYIQCLAAGIPIVSHLWVIDCCRQNKFLKRDNYILPAGFSIITNALPSDKNTFRKSSTLFKGMKFYFGSKTPEKLTDLWLPVLAAAQAVIVDQSTAPLFPNITRKTVDIMIGDPSCPNELVKKAKQMKIPVVSSEYIVQCLINGRKLPYDQNVMFSYTYNKNNTL